MTQEMPLVIYPTNGERQVIGTAIFHPDTGEIEAEVTDPNLMDVLTPKTCSYSVYVDNEKKVAHEVAAILRPALEGLKHRQQ